MTNVIEHIDQGLPAAFVWDYDDRRPRLTKLYEKSKLAQWNATTDLDWTIDVDPSAINANDERFRAIDFGQDRGPIHDFISASPENAATFFTHDHAWLVSQFMHGEQGALVATAKICTGAETIDDKYYAAAQVGDEARHVEAYQLYLDKVGLAYPCSTALHELLTQVMEHRHLDMTFLGMQILVEGVALAAFSMGGALFANTLIKDITELIRRDEARHVAFGVLSLQGRYHDMDRVDLAEREEFVLEACALMRDRFIPVDVWERLGIDVAAAKAKFMSGVDMAAFRSLLFSKVVPNLRKLGLLTPRVRAGFEQMGILRYERYIDSATEAGEIEADDTETSGDLLASLRASLGDVERVAPGPVLQVLKAAADPATIRAAGTASIRLNVSGIDEGDWTISFDDGVIDIHPRTEADRTDVTASMDVETWTGIVTGRLTAPAALLEGRLALEGDVMKALAFESIL